jgi:hypothetical protein
MFNKSNIYWHFVNFIKTFEESFMMKHQNVTSSQNCLFIPHTYGSQVSLYNLAKSNSNLSQSFNNIQDSHKHIYSILSSNSASLLIIYKNALNYIYDFFKTYDSRKKLSDL